MVFSVVCLSIYLVCFQLKSKKNLSCSPLSRQDLVSWKMALDRRQLPEVDRNVRNENIVIVYNQVLNSAYVVLT
jgi:hypothetical protein